MMEKGLDMNIGMRRKGTYFCGLNLNQANLSTDGMGVNLNQGIMWIDLGTD
jgi:hypothetical protein